MKLCFDADNLTDLYMTKSSDTVDSLVPFQRPEATQCTMNTLL